MNAASIERLLLKSGERVTDAHIRALDSAIDAGTIQPGPHVRRRVLPWGTSLSYDSTGGAGEESPFFRPSIRRLPEGFEVIFAKGFLAGVEPIQEPPLVVPPEAFNSLGESLVYLRLDIDPDWTLRQVVPVAYAAAPEDAPWTAHTLALVLYADGTHWRAIHFNQRWIPVSRRPAGTATHLFWPAN